MSHFVISFQILHYPFYTFPMPSKMGVYENFALKRTDRVAFATIYGGA
ncbi:MAG: hypothetical protein ACK4Y7_01070 [Caldimicrobium sp.]